MLDRRLAKTLGTREIYVALDSQEKDVRLAIRHLASGAIELQSQFDHKGGRLTTSKGWFTIDIRDLSRTPRSVKIKGSEQANGLYLVCSGAHIGKLVRRLLYIKAHPPNQEKDTWLMQVVRCVWGNKGKQLTHTEYLENEEIRLQKGQFVLVHETEKTKDKASEMLVHRRLHHGGHTNGWTVQNGRPVKEKDLK